MQRGLGELQRDGAPGDHTHHVAPTAFENGTANRNGVWSDVCACSRGTLVVPLVISWEQNTSLIYSFSPAGRDEDQERNKPQLAIYNSVGNA